MNAGQRLEPGVWGILATPFTGQHLSVDVESLARLVDHYREIGATGVVALGVLGEAGRLDTAERETVLRTVVGSAGSMPVVAGMAATSTAPAMEESKRAAQCGAHAVMVLVSTPDGSRLAEHLERVSHACGLGIVLQDHPKTTGVTIASATLARAASSSGTVVAIKAESPPTAPTVATFVANANIPVFGGLGGVSLLDELLAGSSGAMTGFAFPEVLVATVSAWENGGYPLARDTYMPWLPLVIHEAQDGIGLSIRKEILRRRGLIDEAQVRFPGMPAPPSALAALDVHLGAVQSNLHSFLPRTGPESARL